MTFSVPDYAHIAAVVSDVADNVRRGRHSGGIRSKFTSGQIQQGDAYMDALRLLLQHCGPLMNRDDESKIQIAYTAAIIARERLEVNNGWKLQRLRDARNFKSWSKKSYQTTKGASDRALDKKLLGRFCVTDPPASPSTPEELELGGTGPAGSPPATPGEPYRPQPQDRFTDPDSHAAPTSSHSESIQDTKITILSPGAAGIGGSMDDASDTYSSIYNLYFTSSSTSIPSLDYTVRSVNSHKSRHNTLPPHKYLDCGPSHLRDPQDLLSSGANDASVPETELMDESISSPLSDQPISLILESVLESGPPDAQRSTAYNGEVESPPPGPSSNHCMTGGAQGGESGES